MTETRLLFFNIKPICFGLRQTVINETGGKLVLESLSRSNMPEVGLYKKVEKEISREELQKIIDGELEYDLGIKSPAWL